MQYIKGHPAERSERRRPVRGVALVLAVVTLVAVGCSGGIEGDGDDTDEAVEAAVGVTFDGSGCTVEVADPIASGDRLFILASSQDVVPDVAVLRLPEGVPYDEFAAAQTPGGVIQGGVGEASVSFGSLPDLEPNQKARRYLVEKGQYAIAAISLNPSGSWICGPLLVAG